MTRESTLLNIINTVPPKAIPPMFAALCLLHDSGEEMDALYGQGHTLGSIGRCMFRSTIPTYDRVVDIWLRVEP